MASVQFCEDWDQTFDPNYVTMPLKTFEPMVRRLSEYPGNYAD